MPDLAALTDRAQTHNGEMNLGRTILSQIMEHLLASGKRSSEDGGRDCAGSPGLPFRLDLDC
jgi:hypothetical protein